MANLRKGSFAIGSAIIIGLVIVSFMFTGYQGFSGGGSDTVASVDGEPIKVDEFRNEYQRQVQFYKQFFGGKDLNQKQIKQFGIEDAALRNLISRKLVANLADQSNISIGKKELSAFIQKQPYFQTDNQFDVTKYKALLRANRYTPSQYEDLMRRDIKIRKADVLFTSHHIPQDFVNDLVRIKKNQLEISGAKLLKDSLQKHIPVSKDEIKTYISSKENEAKISSLFESKKASYTTPEQVQASHILIKPIDGKDEEALKKLNEVTKGITTATFASLANKYTEDPSGKKKGGDLGWFGKGRMAKEFEKTAFSLKKGEISSPIKTQFGYHIIHVRDKKAAIIPKLDTYKDRLAKELIQRTKKEEHKSLISDVKTKLVAAFQAGDMSAVETLRRKYNFEYKKTHQLSRIGTQGLTLGITNEVVADLFKKFKDTPVIEQIEKPTYISVVKALKIVEDKKIQLDAEKKSQDSLYTSKFRKEAIDVLQKSARIKQFTTF